MKIDDVVNEIEKRIVYRNWLYEMTGVKHIIKQYRDELIKEIKIWIGRNHFENKTNNKLTSMPIEVVEVKDLKQKLSQLKRGCK